MRLDPQLYSLIMIEDWNNLYKEIKYLIEKSGVLLEPIESSFPLTFCAKYSEFYFKIDPPTYEDTNISYNCEYIPSMDRIIKKWSSKMVAKGVLNNFKNWIDLLRRYLIMDNSSGSIEDGKEYIMRTLMENSGVYNLYLLQGNKFKNETERFSIIQELIDSGTIKKLDSAIGQTYMLTQKYRNEQILLYKHLILTKLNQAPDEELAWDNLIFGLQIPEMYKIDLKKILNLEGYISISTSTKQGDLIKREVK